MSIPKENQKKWAELKYLIMSRSQEDYQQIRQLFRNNRWDDEKEAQFQRCIQHALEQPPTKGSLQNAYQHVWGYFKTIATEAEKADYQKLLYCFSVENDLFLPFLQELAEKYQVDYLLESKLLFDKTNNTRGAENNEN